MPSVSTLPSSLPLSSAPSTSVTSSRQQALATGQATRSRTAQSSSHRLPVVSPSSSLARTTSGSQRRVRESQYLDDTSRRRSLQVESKPLPSIPPEATSVTNKPKHSKKASIDMTSPLAIKLDIKLERDGNVMNMFGGARTGTSYSLPGHIVVTVPASGSPALESSPPLHHRVLKSLQVTFEGKSEFFDEHGRYTPLRLVTVSKSILSEPVVLPSSRSKTGLLTFAHPFDLVIPGWLPPSHLSNMTNTSYGLVAKATVGWEFDTQTMLSKTYDFSAETIRKQAAQTSQPSVQPHGEAAHFSAYRSRIARSIVSALHPTTVSHSHPTAVNKAISTWKSIVIARHRLPPSAEQPNGAPDAQPGFERHYTLKPEANSPSPVECVVSVPEWVDATGGDHNLKVSIRLRARSGYIAELAGLEHVDSPEPVSSSVTSNGPPARNTRSSSQAQAQAPKSTASKSTPTPVAADAKTHMIELGMEVEETERFTSVPAQTFTSFYPIPAEQPSAANSSVGPHAFLSPRTPMADVAMMGINGPPETPYRAIRSRALLLADDGQPRNFQFAGDGLELGDKWRKVNVVLPMTAAHEGMPRSEQPQPELEGPFLRIRHKLKVRVVCRSELTPGSDTVVILSTPLRFGTAPPQPRGTVYVNSRPVPAVPLPAYTQLFHENGEQRDGEPLPIYEPSQPLDDPPSFESLMPPVSREGLELSRESTPTPPVDDGDAMEVDGSSSEDEDTGSSSAGDTSLSSDADNMDVCPPQPPTPRTPGGRKITETTHTTPFVAGLAL